ncbi:ADP-ribosylglycohydrolase [Bifidobacterium sp. DSM 109958]|uniref:ADP-ribosylglycohydrolase n=2 Tax=Bifidobacterium moraviense TaxID=2675323 RepID=A0A7Y0HYZ0_9BIFI|nr:ADP-ribosylglycohydrolase [Bifidobacterium sp. DSM 109958]
MDASFDYAAEDEELGGALSLHVGTVAYGDAMHVQDPQEKDRLFRKACRWYERSASLGNAQAATNLGYVYLYGRIGSVDADRAFAWFSRGAELGNEESCYKLGDLYRAGRGCEKDMDKAVDLYHRVCAIAQQTCDPDVPDQAAVLASIFLRLAEWHERFRPSDESMQLAEELYARSANLFETAVDGGLDWYGKALENARRGRERLRAGDRDDPRAE